MKQYITEAQRLQKLAGITEARVLPQRMGKRTLRGSISPEEWEAIGPGFRTEEWGNTFYITPQGFSFSMDPETAFSTDPKTAKLSCELQKDDYDPGGFQDWVVDEVFELKKLFTAAGYDLEIREYGDGDLMLYLPV